MFWHGCVVIGDLLGGIFNGLRQVFGVCAPVEANPFLVSFANAAEMLAAGWLASAPPTRVGSLDHHPKAAEKRPGIVTRSYDVAACTLQPT